MQSVDAAGVVNAASSKDAGSRSLQHTSSLHSEMLSLPSELFLPTHDAREQNAFVRDAWLAVAGMVTVRLFDNKALGVLATRDLAQGECLLREWPLLRLTPDGAGRFDGMYHGERDRARALLSTLSAAKPGAGDLGGVIETNGIVVNAGRRDAITVVNLMISRCNHSCSPNAAFGWEAELQPPCSLSTKWPIRAGEEITINYLGSRGSRARRQRLLLKRFNFVCTCELCSLSGEALERSDAHEEEQYLRDTVASSSEDEDEDEDR
jgi:hypothetical protein